MGYITPRWVGKKGPEFKYFLFQVQFQIVFSIMIMKFYPALFKYILHSEDFSWIILHRYSWNTKIYKWLKIQYFTQWNKKVYFTVTVILPMSLQSKILSFWLWRTSFLVNVLLLVWGLWCVTPHSTNLQVYHEGHI